MNRQKNRRKVRKRKSPGENSRVKFGVFLGIMVLAVFFGYLTARFVVGPMIGYDADESPTKVVGQSDEKADKEAKKDAGKDADKDSNEEKTVSAAPTEGYALQFGAFSTREAAEKLSETLKGQGITTEIIEIDDAYKVISPVVDTKEKALDDLEELSDKDVTDVFVASF